MNRLQTDEGWLADERLQALAEEVGAPLHRIEGLASFYTHYRRTPPAALQFDVCRDISCHLAREPRHLENLQDACAARDDIEIREVSCLGRCDRAPAVAVGDRTFQLDDQDLLQKAQAPERAVEQAKPAHAWGEAAVYDKDEPPWRALRRSLGQERGAATRELEAAGLRGMGGGAFPTGRKWSLVASQSDTCRYVVCNADESEPGAFKDREILRDLPHLVIEGMALAALEIGARRGWIFIRHEYHPERKALEKALHRAYEEGALGSSVFGTDFSFDIEIFVSPGGYILGEETALLECLEDRRGEPRNKPPLPGEAGLFGHPTLINNVETFVHATGIVHRGAAWWRALGRGDFAGHKFLSVSGDVELPGVVLVAIGTPIGEVLERCGGMRAGARLAVFSPGGASSNFLGPESLATAVDFDALAEAGSMLGAGSLVFIAEGRDMLDVGRNVARFFHNESCGKCVPCRVGIEKALERIEPHGTLSPESHRPRRRHSRHPRTDEPVRLGPGRPGPPPFVTRTRPGRPSARVDPWLAPPSFYAGDARRGCAVPRPGWRGVGCHCFDTSSTRSAKRSTRSSS